MARTHARIYTTIWQDPDFIALSANAQRVYLLALSQPGLSYCGVVGYMPRRWANLAGDTKAGNMTKGVAELVSRGFVLVDEDTEELWICAFVKYDGFLENNNVNVITAMWKDCALIYSPRIRECFLASLPDVAWENPLAESYTKPLGKGYPDSYASPSPSPTPGAEVVSLHDDEQLVFDTWILSTEKSGRTVLSAERRRVIRRALQQYPLEDVLCAVQGWKFSPHHRGENDRKTVYNDIELLLRSPKQIENFRDLQRAGPTLGFSPALGENDLAKPREKPTCPLDLCGGSGNVTDPDGVYIGRCKCVGGPVEAVSA